MTHPEVADPSRTQPEMTQSSAGDPSGGVTGSKVCKSFSDRDRFTGSSPIPVVPGVERLWHGAGLTAPNVGLHQQSPSVGLERSVSTQIHTSPATEAPSFPPVLHREQASVDRTSGVVVQDVAAPCSPAHSSPACEAPPMLDRESPSVGHSSDGAAQDGAASTSRILDNPVCEDAMCSASSEVVRSGACETLNSMNSQVPIVGREQQTDSRTFQQLKQDSIKNIEANAMLQIQSQAQRWVRRKVISGEEYKDSSRNRLFCCFPGNEVSTHVFDNVSTNYSLNLKIRSNGGGGTGSRFLTFAICLVADLRGAQELLAFRCSYQLTAAIHQDMITMDKDYEEASFQFYITSSDGVEIEVEKCGVHVFYVDAESYIISDVMVSNQNFDSQQGDGGCRNYSLLIIFLIFILLLLLKTKVICGRNSFVCYCLSTMFSGIESNCRIPECV
ncbi:hypothetical protein V6N13_038521 [Hibiscus sabdariffa]